MTSLVSISKEGPFEGKLVTDSLKVAEFFGKEHRNVLRDVKHLIDNTEMGVLNFEQTPYTHPQNGQTYYYYTMTEDGFTLLVMGYNGEKELKFKEAYIKAFRSMRTLLESDDYIALRAFQILQKRLSAEEQKAKELQGKVEELATKNQLLDTTIRAQAPKVQYVDEVLQAVNTWTTTTIAKELNMSAIRLNKILEDQKIQYRHQNHYVLYSKYHDKGFAKTKTYTYPNQSGETCTNMQLVWTEQGRAFIHKLIKGNESKTADHTA